MGVDDARVRVCACVCVFLCLCGYVCAVCGGRKGRTFFRVHVAGKYWVLQKRPRVKTSLSDDTQRRPPVASN